MDNTQRVKELAGDARKAGSRAIISGKWLTEATLDLAQHLPIRDREALEAHHDKTGLELADAIIRNAALASAGVGATAGALMAAEEFVLPAWASIPVELAAETALIVALEFKMIAELHEALGQPVPGTGVDRVFLLGKSWAERRGLSPADLVLGVGAADVFGRQARHALTIALRRRLTRRLGRNLATLIPLMAGAVAGAVLNRRATIAIGEIVRDDLLGEPVMGAPMLRPA